MNTEDYERTGRTIYASFADTVATILIAAIKSEGGYRLQQVAKRAEDLHSLRKKLQERHIEGTTTLYGHVRSIVAVLDVNSPLIKKAEAVLQEAGVVRGEFGFADLHERRKALLEPWLTDENERVRAFARSQIRQLEQSIAAETRSSDASIALRKLSYGEELGSSDERTSD